MDADRKPIGKAHPIDCLTDNRQQINRRTVLQERVVLINSNGNFAVSRGACDPLGVVIRLAVSISFKRLELMTH